MISTPNLDRCHLCHQAEHALNTLASVGRAGRIMTKKRRRDQTYPTPVIRGPPSAATRASLAAGPSCLSDPAGSTAARGGRELYA